MFSVYILCRKENGGSTKVMRIKNINKRNGEKVNKSNYPPPILKTAACKTEVKLKNEALKSEPADALSDGYLLRCRYLPSS